MNRIQMTFDGLKESGRSALVPYITAGDPKPWVTVPLMHGMVEAGADILEIGVPFSDPMADGPTIQLACERALQHNISLTNVLEMVTEFRKKDSKTPVVLMGYLNPVEVMGYVAFAQRAKAAGVDGLLTVDMPPEEAHELLAALEAENIAPIFLLSPTSSDDRIKYITNYAKGFLYYVSLKGVTGVKSLDVEGVSRKLESIRALTDMPVGVGFGIRDAETAAQVAAVADAVVVGSAVVQKIEQYKDKPDQIISAVPLFIRELRTAMDRK